MITIEVGDPDEPRVASLVRRAEEYAYSLYPPHGVHMLAESELASPSVRFLVARSDADGDPLGCGAIVLRPPADAELKRMFVEPAARRLGVGAGILRELERVAREKGVRTVRLETGPRQEEAIAFYRSFGYVECGPFGDYRDDPYSIFMEKQLT